MTDDTMPPKERDITILRFLRDHDIALPVTPLFLNLRWKEQITFSRKTLRRRLSSLADRGFVNYIDTGDGYYEITGEGIEWLAENDGEELSDDAD